MTTATLDTTGEPSRSKRMERIRFLSHVMAMLCAATSVLLAAAMLVYWVATPSETLLAALGLPRMTFADIGSMSRVFAFVISMIPLGVLIYGLMNARACFKAFAAGQIFSIHTVGKLRAFSLAVLASAFLKPLAGAALSVLLTWNASGPKSLVLNVGSDTLLALIFAGTVAVIAWVMRDAIAIADENAQFV
jgi:Protein of unknown function (DUF2975)